MGINKGLENRIVSVLREIKNKHPNESFGALIVLGYKRDEQRHLESVVHPMKGIDFFKDKEINAYNPEFKDALYRCMTGDSHDGAILIDEHGNVVQNDTALLYYPNSYLKDRGLQGETLAEQFGFKKRVGSRHIAAKSYSYDTKLTVITLSQETGYIRVFDKGFTVYSSVEEEIEKIPRKPYNFYKRRRLLRKAH